MTTNGQGRKRLPSGFATIRDIITFAVGMVIIGNEVLGDAVEPAVLAVGLTMTGLPLVFGASERGKGPPEPPAPPTLPEPPALPEIPPTNTQ